MKVLFVHREKAWTTPSIYIGIDQRGKLFSFSFLCFTWSLDFLKKDPCEGVDGWFTFQTPAIDIYFGTKIKKNVRIKKMFIGFTFSMALDIVFGIPYKREKIEK